MRSDDDFFMKALSSLAEKAGYDEIEYMTTARADLSACMITPQLLPGRSTRAVTFDEVLEGYNDTAEALAFNAESDGNMPLACSIWVGSRIMLARVYLGHDREHEAADAMEDGILYVESRQPSEPFDLSVVKAMKEAMEDLRAWW